MHVGHHGAGVAARVAVLLGPVEKAAVPFRKTAAVALVDRVGLVAGGNLQVALHAHEGADGRIEDEHVHAPAEGEHENGRRAVQDIPRRDLSGPWLEQRVLRARRPSVIGQNAEDRSHGGADVEV